MLFITLMTKMSDIAEAKYKYDKSSPKLSRAPQGRRLGDEHLEVLVVLVALSELPKDIYKGYKVARKILIGIQY